MKKALTKLLKGVIMFSDSHRKFYNSKPTLWHHFKGLYKNVKFVKPKDITENMQPYSNIL